MLKLLKTIFTWWNSATVGTRWFTMRKGEFVGSDEVGNRYYLQKGKIVEGMPRRRWVIYNGTVEASRVPVDWHGWLHYTFDEPPTKEPFIVKDWELPHQPNLTGTLQAYHPSGSLWQDGARKPATGDYEAWSPE